MAKSLQTTGQLREFLANMLLGIKSGDVKFQEANSMTRMASQINESFYSEIKIAKVRKDAGSTVAELGALPLNT